MLKKFVSYWLMPLPLCTVLILAGTILLFRQRTARFGRGLVAAGLLLLMLFANAHVSRALIRPLETKYPPIPAFATLTGERPQRRCSRPSSSAG